MFEGLKFFYFLFKDAWGVIRINEDVIRDIYEDPDATIPSFILFAISGISFYRITGINSPAVSVSLVFLFVFFLNFLEYIFLRYFSVWGM